MTQNTLSLHEEACRDSVAITTGISRNTDSANFSDDVFGIPNPVPVMGPLSEQVTAAIFAARYS